MKSPNEPMSYECVQPGPSWVRARLKRKLGVAALVRAWFWVCGPRWPGIAVLLLGQLFWVHLLAAAGPHDVIINEIMYHPPGDLDNLQFIELFNRSDSQVDLSRWSFTKGIKFTFPNGARIAPGAYLVISRDPAAFTKQYGQGVVPLGPFTGRLGHKTERLELSDAGGAAVDSVKYSDSAGWARGADGYSSSLERICPEAPGDLAANWAASPWPASKRAAGSPGRQNDSYSKNLPPGIASVEFTPKTPRPQQSVKVTADVTDVDGVKAVVLLYRVAGTGKESEEKPLPMTRSSGDDKSGRYEAAIPGQAQGQIVRFRVRATDSAGTERIEPTANEPRPTYSYVTFENTAKARIALGQVINIGRPGRGPGHYERTPKNRAAPVSVIRGSGAFVYVPADTGEAELFDYVTVVGRHGGYKVHFQKDHPLKGLKGINLISEGPMRWILAEPLAYSVYRMAGVPAPLTEHVRLSIDGRALGFHLLVEQPNKSFLARNDRDDSGNLYKLLWYGHGIVGQHEKKTNPTNGHADLVELIEGLRRKSGADQWAFIQQHFNVDEVINYYAVNMCIQNWDGFFNNYFAYHDTGRTGKWEIYPWDEDKTWGDYDGASSSYDWYEMPLTFGMNGDASPRNFMNFGGGPFGGVSWWRPPGYFSGPLLANPQFRKLFLARLREICQSVFTEENFVPIINAMEQRLEADVQLRAQAIGQDPQHALREFKGYMQSFRSQVKNRRKFLLAELAKAR